MGGRVPQMPLREAAVRNIKRIKGFYNLDLSNEYCFAWVDGYYLPRQALESWVTIVHHIDTVKSASKREGCSFQELKCWGSCCVDAELHDLNSHSCGHRIQLTNKT